MSSYNTEDLARVEPDYLDAFGLREAPFAPHHEDRFFYVDPERAQNLNLLQHLTQYSNLLLIVQGETGAGKTALLKRFIKHAEPDWQVCEVTANTMMDAEQLLFQAAQGFGMTQLPEDAGQLQENLYARVATLHHNDQVPILIIDDAHLLPRDALLTIFHLADAYVNDVNLLRIILFSEPLIEKIINTNDIKPLRDRVTHTMEITPLDEAATAEYLKHRLAVAGFVGGSPFTPRMIKKIHRASGGIPAEINQLAHKALESGDISGEEVHADDPEPILHNQLFRQKRSMMLATLAVIVVAVVLVFQDRINSIFEDEPPIREISLYGDLDEEVPKPQSALQEPAETDLPESSGVQEKIIPLNETGEVSPVVEKTVEPPADEPAQPIIEQADVASPEPLNETVTALQLLSVEPNPVPGSRQRQTITLNGRGFTPDSDVIVSWTGNEKRLSAQQVSVKSENQIELAITVGTSEDTWRVQVADPVNGTSNYLGFQVLAAVNEQGYQRDKWVLAQDPGGFTLQLFASHTRQSVEGFIRQHQLTNQAGYFQTLRNGRPWFSVVYGQYTDQAAATQAARSLPVSLNKVKPWVRRFDDIHASINTSRKQMAKDTKPEPSDLAKTRQPTSNLDPDTNASWLWSQDPSKFTLQLLGARESASVQKFLRKYTRLNGKAVYFHTRHDARDWYTVVYGVYPSRESAKQAISRLPQELRSASPWIRSFGSIHAELGRTDRE